MRSKLIRVIKSKKIISPGYTNYTDIYLDLLLSDIDRMLVLCKKIILLK